LFSDAVNSSGNAVLTLGCTVDKRKGIQRKNNQRQTGHGWQ